MSRAAWITGLSLPAVLACVAVGVTLGSGGYTFYYGQGLSYLSNDPKACMNCHIMRDHYDGWAKGSHHAHATCNDCHTPHSFFAKYWVKAENGVWHSKGFTLQDFHEPIRIRAKNSRVLQHNCIECHRGVVEDIIGHDENDVTTSCVRCHATVGHGPTR
jgi:cytochrome c nitrite reductase small subunit